MSKYTKYQNKTKEKLQQYGNEVLVKHILQEEYNYETNEYEREEEIIQGYGVQNSFNIQHINGSVIQAGDVVLMCSLDKAPCIADKIVFGGKEYSVVDYRTENPDGTCVIYYDILCR